MLLVAAVFACSAPAEARLVTRAPPHRVSRIQESIVVDGRPRTYWLYVPAAFQETRGLPLVIVLHGGGGSGRNVEAFTVGGFNDLAEREGFVVAYPDAMKFPLAKRNWNDGRKITRYPAQRTDVDDVRFIAALIDHLVATRGVDPDRVYATGPSNGGHMSLRLGCELAPKLAAIAPVIGLLPELLAPECHPARRLPVLMVNGVADPLVPWDGGYCRLGRAQMGRVLSVAQTVGFWAARNGCDPAPRVELLPDRDPQDGTRVRRESYSHCDEQADVVLYAVEGGGHTWPGAYQYATEQIVGKTSQDMSACEVIWEFFKRHHR